MKREITLHGGPWNVRTTEYGGESRIRMSIIRDCGSNGPVAGADYGLSIYEPAEDRTQAHWSHNEWDGTFEGSIKA